MKKYLNILARLSFPVKLGTLLLTGMIVMVVYQYIGMRHAAKELAVLKEDYRTYVMGLRRMLREKNKHDRAEPEGDVKKKTITDHQCSFSGVYRACSNHPSDCFSVVNRSEQYLKLHALHYVREKKVADYKQPSAVVTSRKRIARKRPQPTYGRQSLIGSSKRLLSLPTTDTTPWERDFSFSWPVERSKFWISSRFGPRKMGKLGWRFHGGVDMAAHRGTPVLASAGGIVVESGWIGGYGKCIVIMHNKKYKTRYAHLSKRYVEVGEKVERGKIIGAVGDTGFVKKKGVDASHLHFEVYSFGRRINPLSVLV